jgi:hypothetical protein
MKNTISTKSKLDAIKDDDFQEVQPYFKDKSVEEARMEFKIRTQMWTEIPGNAKDKYRVKRTVSEGLTCQHCTQEAMFTQSRCLTCPEWTEICEGLDMTKIDDLVVFFRKLLVEKDKV